MSQMGHKLGKLAETLVEWESNLRYAWSKEARRDPLNRGTIVSLFVLLFFAICMFLLKE